MYRERVIFCWTEFWNLPTFPSSPTEAVAMCTLRRTVHWLGTSCQWWPTAQEGQHFKLSRSTWKSGTLLVDPLLYTVLHTHNCPHSQGAGEWHQSMGLLSVHLYLNYLFYLFIYLYLYLFYLFIPCIYLFIYIYLSICISVSVCQSFVFWLYISSRVMCGIIARSAGLFQNTKKVCTCDGVTIWDEAEKVQQTDLRAALWRIMFFFVSISLFIPVVW